MAEHTTSDPDPGAQPDFPDGLMALAAADVCGDDAWDRWAAGDQADREAELDADLERPPTRAVRIEEGFDRVARSLTRVLPRPAPHRGSRRHRARPAGDLA